MCRRTERYILKENMQTDKYVCILQTERLNDILIDKLRCADTNRKNLQIDLPKNTHTGMWIGMHTARPADEHTYTDIDRKSTAIHTHIHIYTHIHTHIYVQIIHTYMFENIYIYIYIYIYIRTHIHPTSMVE